MKTRVQAKDIDDALALEGIAVLSTDLVGEHFTLLAPGATPWTLGEWLQERIQRPVNWKLAGRVVQRLERKGYISDGCCCCGRCSGWFKLSELGWETAVATRTHTARAVVTWV